MKTEFFLGCSGFYYAHWSGRFYPENLSKSKWLQYYSQHFNTVEVNNTFYRFPRERILQDWYSKTPENFHFTLKANRVITHTYKFSNTEKYTENFYELAHILREKLLCVLFQMPPFTHKNLELLEKISKQFDLKVANVLEFRHVSWWDNEVYDFMRKKHLIFCSVSASGFPETLIKTAPDVYVRFHGKNGRYKHNYPDGELAEWAGKIKQQNARRVFCYFNNDYNANAPKNCETLKKLLE